MYFKHLNITASINLALDNSYVQISVVRPNYVSDLGRVSASLT